MFSYQSVVFPWQDSLHSGCVKSVPCCTCPDKSPGLWSTWLLKCWWAQQIDTLATLCFRFSDRIWLQMFISFHVRQLTSTQWNCRFCSDLKNTRSELNFFKTELWKCRKLLSVRKYFKDSLWFCGCCNPVLNLSLKLTSHQMTLQPVVLMKNNAQEPTFHMPIFLL